MPGGAPVSAQYNLVPTSATGRRCMSSPTRSGPSTGASAATSGTRGRWTGSATWSSSATCWAAGPQPAGPAPERPGLADPARPRQRRRAGTPGARRMTARPARATSLSIVLPASTRPTGCRDPGRLPGLLPAEPGRGRADRGRRRLHRRDLGHRRPDRGRRPADPGGPDPRNHGKGYAVQVGVQAAQGELVVFTDADGSYGPDQLERVVAALDRAPVAIGARLGAQPGAGSLLRRLASPVFNRVMRSCSRPALLRRSAGSGLPPRRCRGGLPAGPGGRVRLRRRGLLVARRLGLEVVEVPVAARSARAAGSACAGTRSDGGRRLEGPPGRGRRRLRGDAGPRRHRLSRVLVEFGHRPLGHRAGGGRSGDRNTNRL